MSLESGHFFVCVVVEDAQLEIIGASNEPVLPCNKFHTAHRDLCDLKRLDYRTRFMIIDVDSAVVETGEEPGFCGMKIDSLDPI